MAESKIEWTGRSDWNPIRGCTRVSPGCGGPGPHGGCYAEQIAGRFSDEGQAFHGFATRTSAGGRWTGRVELVEERITLPMRWRKPGLVFASSTSDFFHEALSDADIDRLFAVMALSPHLTFQILTKRSDRMQAYLSDGGVVRRICSAAAKLRIEAAPDPERWPNKFHAFLRPSAKLTAWTHRGGCAADMFERNEPGRDWPSWVKWPLPNVWSGVSVEDQQRADGRREQLRAAPAAVKFVSYEPALGPVDWSGWEFVDQIIGGGESGLRARPMHPDWQRATRDFCAAHEIAYFFKQHGEWVSYLDRDRDDPDWRAGYSDFERSKSFAFLNHAGGCGFHGERLQVMQRVGRKAAGRLLDGVQHDGMPA